MIEDWGAKHTRDLAQETSHHNLRKLSQGECKKLFFDCIRAKNLDAVTNMLAHLSHLAITIMYGYEGTDIHNEIEGGEGRCLHYTDLEKDGFFYPVHVAAECGSKEILLLLAREPYHADLEVLDYRNCTAESKCGKLESRHAFFELRGIFFASKERYQGNSNKITGMRHGAGALYFKPEGFDAQEKLLYRGTFKDNVFHGQGALYWPGSDILHYKGRMKEGMKHGRGVLFDENGNKVYQGTFRNDKKDGRGEMFEATEGLQNRFSRTYQGDFENDMMHGFGVGYYGDAGTFVGRFENGMKAGVGVYAYPNGDRFEGMFFGDKPDGKGSYYTAPADGKGPEVGSHFIWQNGRKSSQVETPFVPDKLDMPDPDEEDGNKAVMAALATQSDDASLSSVDTDKMRSSKRNAGNGADSSKSSAKSKDNGGKDVKEPPHIGVDASGTDWKLQLGRAVRISGKTAKTLGMEDPIVIGKPKTNKSGEDRSLLPDKEDEEAAEESSDEESPDMDDVIGTHFLKFPPVFTCYAYVCSASKVFEERDAAETDVAASLQANTPMMVPEFDSVYYLVMDAVEDYNERWEKAFTEQKSIEDVEAQLKKDEDDLDITPEQSVTGNGRKGSTGLDALHQQGVVSKMKSSNIFMTDAEKRKELKRKQRIELAAKRGGDHLDKETEHLIGFTVYENLEKELQELTSDEMQGEDMHGPTRARPKYMQSAGEMDEFAVCELSPSNEFATELLYLLRIARATM